MRPTGLLVILVTLTLPAWGFSRLSSDFPAQALISQYVGVSAIIFMSWTQVLALRARATELLFGGLDRQYQLHKWLGILAIAAIMLHENLDAEIKAVALEGGLGDLGETFGDISQKGLLALVIISLLTFVPYHWWRWTHRLIGLFFALGTLHFFLVDKPFALTSGLGLYVSFFCWAGVLAFVYTQVRDVLSLNRLDYKVDQVEKTGDVLSLSLTPATSKSLAFRAGQFAFFTFESSELRRLSVRQTHPFTIASAPQDEGKLALCIKASGDFTRALYQDLAPGAKIGVQGGFGRFTPPSPRHEQVWIAGGIGITPFLAWLEKLTTDEKEGKTKRKPVTLFYCLRSRTDAPALDRLGVLAARYDWFNLVVVESSKGHRLASEHVLQALEGPVSKARVAFCGPEALRETLKEDLRKAGLGRRHFMYEEFHIRSGLPLAKLARWIWRKVKGLFKGKSTKKTSA